MSQFTEGDPLETTGVQMLTVRVDTVTVHNGRLVFGCVVEGPKRAWIRFAVAEVPLSSLDYSLFQQIGEEWDREHFETEDDPSLF